MQVIIFQGKLKNCRIVRIISHMPIFKFEDFTCKAQIRIPTAQDELNAADYRRIIPHLGHLKLPLKENCESFPLFKTAHFIVREDKDGTKSYVFSHADLSQDS